MGKRVALTALDCLGRLDDEEIARELGLRPVFVSLARYEPFGLAVLEAAGAGCALVLSDIESFRP
jgi:glycosyltransferase involved in cell wall biosynthesis